MPGLYIITGSNGAGKSSVGPAYLPAHLQGSVFDGDRLYMQKRQAFWAAGIQSPKECRRLAAEAVEAAFDELVASALRDNADFAYEGHFTTDATWRVPVKFKEAGYDIHLLFFGLTDVALSQLRVLGRAREGGHHVDPLTLTSNFYGNLEKLDVYFALFDSVTLLDASGIEHVGLAELAHGKCVAAVAVAELPTWFIDNLPVITRAILENGAA